MCHRQSQLKHTRTYHAAHVVVLSKFQPHREPRSFDVIEISIDCNTLTFFSFYASVSRTSCAALVLCVYLAVFAAVRIHTLDWMSHILHFSSSSSISFFMFSTRLSESGLQFGVCQRVFAAFEKQRIGNFASINKRNGFDSKEAH